MNVLCSALYSLFLHYAQSSAEEVLLSPPGVAALAQHIRRLYPQQHLYPTLGETDTQRDLRLSRDCFYLVGLQLVEIQ